MTFEKPTAAKTALLLDNTQLGTSLVHVSSGSDTDSSSSTTTSSSNLPLGSASDDSHVAQEDKPRARILAEYLAHGYAISDQTINRAIQADQQHGYSARFTSALQAFDAKTHASETAASLDQKLGVTQTAQAGWAGLNSYFEKALGTPTGQRIRGFYQVGEKQVLDVHNEARRLADLKSGGVKKVPHETDSGKTVCSCGANEAECGCAMGTCGCRKCGKNTDEKKPTPEEAGMQKVGGERTVCNCGGSEGKCPCKSC